MRPQGPRSDEAVTPTILFVDRCLECDQHISGRTQAALDANRDEHTAYVNRMLDRADDPHFEDVRLNHLVAS